MAIQMRYHVPLLHSFREAFEKGDARKETRQVSDGDRVLSQHDVVRRRGLNESQIRQLVIRDLEDIFSTIDLQSAVDLHDLEFASKSIINYGLYDLTHMTSEDAEISRIEANLVAALLCYEPRIRKDSLQVERQEIFDSVGQRVRLSVYAEVSHRPMNVPIDFTAEVDLSSGKADITHVSGLS